MLSIRNALHPSLPLSLIVSLFPMLISLHDVRSSARSWKDSPKSQQCLHPSCLLRDCHFAERGARNSDLLIVSLSPGAKGASVVPLIWLLLPP